MSETPFLSEHDQALLVEHAAWIAARTLPDMSCFFNDWSTCPAKPHVHCEVDHGTSVPDKRSILTHLWLTFHEGTLPDSKHRRWVIPLGFDPVVQDFVVHPQGVLPYEGGLFQDALEYLP